MNALLKGLIVNVRKELDILLAPAPRLSNEEKRKRRRSYLEKNKERRAELSNFHAAKRRAKKIQRVPSWADGDEIEKIYARARALTRETGTPHHVDHIIPLQGKNVSGLHVESNLQIIPASQNQRKYNNYEP